MSENKNKSQRQIRGLMRGLYQYNLLLFLLLIVNIIWDIKLFGWVLLVASVFVGSYYGKLRSVLKSKDVM